MPPINASVTNQQITASVGETQIDVSVSGGVGPTGTAGAAASVTVGTVTTGAPGSSASVVNAGTSSAAVLNFTIPAGAAGATGSTGPRGEQGIQGVAGIQGPAGATGATGPAGSNATATTNASLLTSGTLDAARLPGSVVLTTDARLSDARQPLTHQHTAAQISDFTSAVVAAAPPTTNASLLTSGTIPDARISSNIARTSDVSSAVAAVVGAAPESLNTLQELSAALANDASFSATVTNSLASKAPINNPTFTGTVSGITKSMVGLGSVDNTADASKPVSTATQTALDGKAATSHTHTVSAITDAGTAATRNVPATGNASSTEVVLGGDTRLTNQRVPTDGSVTAGKIAAGQAVSFRAIAVSGGSFFTGWGIRLVASPIFVENTGGTVLFYVDETGTVTTGTWQGTAVGVAYGGTGATTASAARTNLGLVIGTDVAAASHTHTASAITDFASAVAAASPEEVVEYTTAASFPASGNASLLYRASDSSRLFAWVGSQYAEVGPTSVSAGGGSSADSVLRSIFVPPAPTSLTASPGNAQATLSWSAPSVIAQAPIMDYVVQFSSNSGSTWTTFADGTSTATSATVTGLTNGTAYVFRVAAVNAVGTGAYTAASSSVTPSGSVTAAFLAIAGGGGGGGWNGGGGGAGGYRTSFSASGGGASAESSLTLTPGTTYGVTVGAGGAGGTSSTRGSSGTDSTFHTISATGGGGGGAQITGQNATTGGAGGGQSNGTGTLLGASGTANQGFGGGNRSSSGGGGGGGAGAAGSAGASGGGSGGAGLTSAITGSSVARASGGSGWRGDGSGAVAGTAGGGGGVGPVGQGGQAGTANTGGGGGAGGNDDENIKAGGGNGGSGVIVIRLPVAASATTGSPAVTTSGGDTIYTFTGSGSITI
jgi:hypothetical protein